MSIEFNIGEHIHNDSSGILIKLFISFFGAFLGFLFAILLNKLLDRKLRKKEQGKVAQHNTDLLNFLLIFIDSIVKSSRLQISEIDKFANEIQEKPFNTIRPFVIPVYDFERLQKMSTETFLGAYLSRFEEDHLEMEIKNFKNIFSNTDYLLRVFIEFERMNSRHQDFMYQQKKIVNETFDDVIFKIAKFEERIKPLKQSDPNVDMIFQYFEPFQTIYSENVNRIPDYNVLMNEFFFKLQSSIVDSVKDLGFLEEILPIIKKGGTALSNLERNSLSFVDECREDREKLQNAVEYLEEISKKMKEFKN